MDRFAVDLTWRPTPEHLAARLGALDVDFEGELGLRARDIRKLDQAQMLTAAIQRYQFEHGLYFGEKKPERPTSRPTMMLTLEAVALSEAQKAALGLAPGPLGIAPALNDFWWATTELLRRAFRSEPGADRELDRIRDLVGRNADPASLEAYQQLLSDRSRSLESLLPFSSRPDVQFTLDPKSGELSAKIVEINAETSIDKGNGHGVNRCFEDVIGLRPLGTDLVELFVEGVGRSGAASDGKPLQVATVMPTDYQRAYRAQSLYFARSANELGSRVTPRVAWAAVTLDELEYADGRVWIRDASGERVRIDLVDREFKLPNYGGGFSYEHEMRWLEAYLSGHVGLLGSLLPTGDKILLSIVWDEQFEAHVLDVLESTAPPCGMDAGRRLENMRRFFAETHLLEWPPELSGLAVDESTPAIQHIGRRWSIAELVARRHEDPFVLKVTGDRRESAESKGVIVSTDVDPDALRGALLAGLATGRWIIQRFHRSINMPIEARKNYAGKPLANPASRLRVSPHYVRIGQQARLGTTLVVADIHHRVRELRASQIINGGSETTYTVLL